MDKRFFIPSYDLMAELSHSLKHRVTGGGHALREVYPGRKRRDVKMHLTSEAKYTRKPTFRCHLSKQELGVEFPHLILNRDEQSRFDVWIHALA